MIEKSVERLDRIHARISSYIYVPLKSLAHDNTQADDNATEKQCTRSFKRFVGLTLTLFYLPLFRLLSVSLWALPSLLHPIVSAALMIFSQPLCFHVRTPFTRMYERTKMSRCDTVRTQLSYGSIFFLNTVITLFYMHYSAICIFEFDIQNLIVMTYFCTQLRHTLSRIALPLKLTFEAYICLCLKLTWKLGLGSFWSRWSRHWTQNS